jgi:hypothetical protein
MIKFVSVALLLIGFAASAEAARLPGPWEIGPRRQCLLDAGGSWDRFGRVKLSLRHGAIWRIEQIEPQTHQAAPQTRPGASCGAGRPPPALFGYGWR